VVDGVDGGKRIADRKWKMELKHPSTSVQHPENNQDPNIGMTNGKRINVKTRRHEEDLTAT
jgi:hypothetical protein